MGSPKGMVTLPASAVALALALGATPALAQETPARFGQRDELIVSIERLFGFQSVDYGGDGGSVDTTGFQPYWWAGLGVFSMSSSGLNFGALFGVTRIQLEDDDSSLTGNIFQLRPRIGYGGTDKEGRFGYWVRLGPSAIVTFSESESTSSTGQTRSDSSSGYALGVGGEAYAVFFPAPHVGVLLGPHADFHLYGKDDNDDPDDRDPEYSAFGLTAGIMGEFY